MLEEPEDVTQVARIDMVSEYLAVTVNGTPAASVPDIICLLDLDRRQPVLTDELRPGRHVLAVRIDPPPDLRALPADLVGPTAFGLA